MSETVHPIATATRDDDGIWVLTGDLIGSAGSGHGAEAIADWMRRQLGRAGIPVGEVTIGEGEVHAWAPGVEPATVPVGTPQAPSGVPASPPEGEGVPAAGGRAAGTPVVATARLVRGEWQITTAADDLLGWISDADHPHVVEMILEVITDAGIETGAVDSSDPWTIKVHAPTETTSSGPVTPEDTQDAPDQAGRPTPDAGAVMVASPGDAATSPLAPGGGTGGAGGSGVALPRPHQDGADRDGEPGPRPLDVPAAVVLVAAGLLIGSGPRLPAPCAISRLAQATKALPVQLQMSSAADVDAWAAHHGLAAGDDGWRKHKVVVTVAGHDVEVWAPRPASCVELLPCGPVPAVHVPVEMTQHRRSILGWADAGELTAESGRAWWDLTGTQMTGRVRTLVGAGWLAEGAVLRPGRRRYDVTDAGREAMAEWDRTHGGAA